MAQMSIDELNSFDAEEYIEDYFKPMRISEDRKEERQDAAKDFRDILLLILALIAIEYEKNLLDWPYIQNQFRTELLRVSLMYAADSEAIQDYVNSKSYEFVQITQEQDLSDPYWTSDMRATHEAVNEANDVIAISEMQRAEMMGAVSKRWKTERDDRVRPTHRAVDGVTKAIDEMFNVGKDLMRFPHDWYYSAKESYNCRCGLDYLDEKGKVILVGKMREEVNKTYNKVQFTNADDSITINKEVENRPKQFVRARFATGNMSPEEYARAVELWKRYPEVKGLTAAEKEHVYEELDNNLTAEEKSLCLVRRPIGDYWYKAINKGHNQYKIIDKTPIDPYEDIMDEIYSEAVGRDWKKYDF